MLIILFTFALFRNLHGATVPLTSPSEPGVPFPALDIRDTQGHFGQRSVNAILISCFATIFACTWSAVHPNIPAVTDSAWTGFKRRVTMTVYALLAPELMTYWAMRQRVEAKNIMDQYNRDINGLTLDPRRKTSLERLKGWFPAIFDTISGVFQESPLPPPLKEGEGPQWTLAHGFFLQMGGFMLCENGRPIQTLIDDTRSTNKKETTLIWNIQQKVIDPPRITEDDIKDRSKGDAISKTFIILQTTWFIVQCIARWSQRLPVTELEIVTLGFAMLNGITYGLWWDKPQNAGRPVFLESKKPQSEPSESAVEIESSTAGKSTSEDAETESNPLLQPAEPGKEHWLRRKLRQEMEEHARSPRLLWDLPFRILQALLHPFSKMMENDTVTQMRVGIFYSAKTNVYEAAYATAVIGALFGSVHLIPSWFLDFASRQETWLWRVSAIIITAEPIFLGFTVYTSSNHQDTLSKIFAIPTVIGFALYPIARLVLLMLSLAALRSLPSGVLQTIEWTTFIPHL